VLPPPKISVIIPTFNGENTVGVAIESVLAQDCADYEVIVVNDGSNDGTASILDRYRSRVRIVAQPNSGLAGARNAGVAVATGKYLAFLDDDDTWEANRLSRTCAALEANPQSVMVYSDAVQVDASGRLVESSYTPPEQRHAPAMREMLNEFWNILPSSILVRRETFEGCGGFEEEFKVAFFEDTFFYLRCREQGPFYYLGEKLIRYRRRGAAEAFARRFAPHHQGRDDASVPGAVEKSSRNFDVLIRKVREHYGDAGRKFIVCVERRRLDFLTTFALVAMSRGDIALARRIYRYALRFAPFSPKTWLRLGWTLIPGPIAAAMGALMPERLRRAVSGLPQAS
jgi:glycosyltransferase involved in cell wall biosynthesis